MSIAPAKVLLLVAAVLAVGGCKEAIPEPPDDNVQQEEETVTPNAPSWQGVADEIGLQSSGKIVFSGRVGKPGRGEEMVSGIYRLLDDETIDETFDAAYLNALGKNSYGYSFVVQDDDKILLTGDFEIDGKQHRLVRLLPDGALDREFIGNIPIPVQADLTKFKLTRQGLIYALCYRSVEYELFVLGSDGVLIDRYRSVRDFAESPTGDVFLLRYEGFIFPDNDLKPVHKQEVIKLAPDGTLDKRFRFMEDMTETIERISPLADGSILAYTYYNGLLRLDNTGKIDPGFKGTRYAFLSLPIENSSIMTSHLQSDGKIMLTGVFDVIWDNVLEVFARQTRFARLNPDGMMDPSFSVSGKDLSGHFQGLSEDRFLYTEFHISRQTLEPVTTLRIVTKDGVVTFEKTINGSIINVLVLPDKQFVAVGRFLQAYENGKPWPSQLGMHDTFSKPVLRFRAD